MRRPPACGFPFPAPPCCLREIVGQLAQQIGIDGDAGPLHVGQHRHQRPLQGFVDRDACPRRQLRLEQRMQAQGDVGILGGISVASGDRHAVEGDLVLALAGDFAEGDGRVLTDAARDSSSMPWPCSAACQHIGHQHRVVERRDADAALEEHQVVVFEILRDLQDAWSSSSGFRRASTSASLQLHDRRLRAPRDRGRRRARWPQGM